MTYDNLLEKVNGERYLLKMFAVFFFNGLPNALVTTSIAMMLFVPDKFWCIPTDHNIFVPRSKQFSNFTVEIDDNQCWYTVREGSHATNFTCENHGFENPYDKVTVSMEFDWTCGRTYIKSLVLTLFSFGKLVGTLTGFLSDRFGRRLVFNMSTFLIFVFLLLTSLSVNSVMFALCAFVSSGVAVTNYICSFVLAVECTTPRHRNFMAIATVLSFSLGFALSSLIASLTPNWRWHYGIASSLGIFYIINWWIIPESPRWLMANHKIAQAHKAFQKMAFTNKLRLREDFLQDVETEATSFLTKDESQTKKEEKGLLRTLKDICKIPKIFSIMIVCSLSWFAVTLVYYGITFNLQALSGNLFVNNALMGLVEIPGSLMVYLFVSLYNRPISSGGIMVLCGFFCLGAALLDTVNATVSTIAGFIGKSLNAGGFYMVYLHTTEMFPTKVRNTCTSTASMFGRIGPLFSSYLVLLGDQHGMFIPYLIMSLLAIIVGILILLVLPDTRNVALPETIEDTLKMKTLVSKCCRQRSSRKKSSMKC